MKPEWQIRAENEERYIKAVKLRRKGYTVKELAELFDRCEQTMRGWLHRGNLVMERVSKSKARFRAHKARIDATQPNDPPRGVWIEK